MSNLLKQIDNFIQKSSLHEHDEYRMHPIEKRHRAMRKLNDTYNMHMKNMPHLHSDDQKLVNFIKQSLALKDHNRPYWNVRGKKILKEILSWHNLMDKYQHTMFIESSMRKFCKETGFDMTHVSDSIKKAKRMQREKNYQEAARHIMDSHTNFKKFLKAHFGC